MKFTFITLFENLIRPYFSDSILLRAINDKKIESINQMIKTLLNYSPGDNVNLRVMRDKKILKFKVGLTQEVE